MRAPALLALFCGATFIALSPIFARIADGVRRPPWPLFATAGMAFAGAMVVLAAIYLARR
jgi:hypothetical protein